MYRVRLCWSDHVRSLKQEETTATEWVDANDEGTLALRLLCKEGNTRFGEGSHWIELTSQPKPATGTSQPRRQLNTHSRHVHRQVP